MKLEQIEDRITDAVMDILNLDEAPRFDVSITEELAVDSLDQMTLFMTIEDEFGETLSEEDMAGIDTLNDVAQYFHGRLGA